MRSARALWLLDAQADGVAVIDRQRLTQALVQLAQNAVEHTEDGAGISLGSAIDGVEARFWVRDGGPGISRADQVTIFDRFEQRGAGGHDSGSGLGLSIVQGDRGGARWPGGVAQ